jgi:hypothetical protein
LGFVNPSDINARPFVLGAIAKNLAVQAAAASFANTSGLLQAANQLRTDQQLAPRLAPRERRRWSKKLEVQR